MRFSLHKSQFYNFEKIVTKCQILKRGKIFDKKVLFYLSTLFFIAVGPVSITFSKNYVFYRNIFKPLISSYYYNN